MQKATFEQFYRKNLDRIYRYVLFRVQDREVAEDLVSEIFMKALRAFDRYDASVSQSAWIYQIAHNHVANYYRDRKETVDLEDVAERVIGEDGFQTFVNTETRDRLTYALSTLTKEERQLVTLKHLEGYPYTELARLLDRSPQALRVALHRSMRKLREAYRNKGSYDAS